LGNGEKGKHWKRDFCKSKSDIEEGTMILPSSPIFASLAEMVREKERERGSLSLSLSLSLEKNGRRSQSLRSVDAGIQRRGQGKRRT
jgi:hypothetical protein